MSFNYMPFAPLFVFYADCLRSLQHDLGHQAIDHGAVATLQRRFEIGIRRRPSLSTIDRVLHRAKAFLLPAIIICCRPIPCLNARLDKGAHQGIFHLSPRDMQRTRVPSPSRVAPMTRVIP